METNRPVLAILAGGMGSRYGGLKQIDPIGPNGELIIDYSIYDAKQAGFSKVIFLIKEEMLDVFEETIGKRAKNLLDVGYAFQSVNDIPQGATLPEGRVRPWGTGHAVYALRSAIDGPFGVINADDFYGGETYRNLYRHLSGAADKDKYDYCMVGFRLMNTLTESGAVSRGVCEVGEDGMLRNVTERVRITREGDSAVYEEEERKIPLLPDSIASLNVWGFTPSIFEELEKGFYAFMLQNEGDPLKREYFLPFAVDELIKQGKAQVKVLKTPAKWYGVTYKEDKIRVQEALRQMTDAGIYPSLV